MLTRGGKYRYNLNSLARNKAYQEGLNEPAERIGAEYHHGHFTAGNSLNPMFSIGQAEALSDAKIEVGDFIGLFVVPEHHTIVDIASKVVPAQRERGYQGGINADGMVFTVEARKYSAETLKQTGSLSPVTQLNGIPVNVPSFKRSAILPEQGGYFIPTDEVIVLGVKIEALPSEPNIKISDITARIEITGHVFDYEAPIHL